MTDTWGISGPVFLWAFIGISALSLVGAVAHRRRVLAGPGNLRADRLAPAEVAYLTEGPTRAVYTALTVLHKAALVQVEKNGMLRRTGDLHAGATPLESALLNAATDGEHAMLVPNNQSVCATLSEMESDLTRRGLLVSRKDRWKARFGAWIMLGLLAFGAIRVNAAISSGRPVTYLVLVLMVVATAFIMLLTMPRLTGTAEAALRALRRKHHYFKAKHRPAWQTYDPAMVGLAVGLYGAAMLWEANPELASVADLSFSASSSGYAGGGGGGGSAGGSGCGGGGCGGCGGGGG